MTIKQKIDVAGRQKLVTLTHADNEYPPSASNTDNDSTSVSRSTEIVATAYSTDERQASVCQGTAISRRVLSRGGDPRRVRCNSSNNRGGADDYPVDRVHHAVADGRIGGS